LRKSVVFILLLCLAMAGCWQSRNRPYRNDMSLQPFAAGTVTAVSHDGRIRALCAAQKSPAAATASP